MEDGLLSLKWNNHKTTFFDILRTLREKASYTDATIAVEGKFYPVHKLVMSTCSEYFSEIFQKTPCKAPCIVLKDVRSQDMEALLDYMYLGEVNVNQNDLANLLKTAECLRIKGLAVPDEDNSKSKQPLSEDRQPESPPPKKRRTEEAPPPPPPQIVQPLPEILPPKSPPPHVSPPHPSPLSVSHQESLNLQEHNMESAPMVKVEMEEPDDNEDCFRKDMDGSVHDGDDYGSDLSKAEHDPDNYGGGSSYPGPSIQPGGDLPWDEGDSASFPPEGFTGDLPPGQQPQGDDDEDDDDDDDGDGDGDGEGDSPNECGILLRAPVASIPSSSDSAGGPPPLTPISQARQCQLCLVTLANANLLRRHVEDHHFHIRKYDCVHCGKKFKRKEHRERHIRIHTGEKPFACYICNARFTQKEHLKGHIENVHHKHGERGLDGMGDLDRDEETEEKDDETTDKRETKPPASSSPPATSSSPSLAPVSNLISLASAESPLTSVIPPTTTVASTTPSLIRTVPSLPLTTTTSASVIPSSLANDLNMNQFTALYAPVTRKTVNSPSKHMQTITINFN